MKTILYTCANLDYDQIFSPVVATPSVAHVLFSDRRPRFVRGWRWRPMPPETRGLSPVLTNRYCKFFAHRILPEAECSIYVDANTLVIGDLRPLIAEFLASGAQIGLFPHKERSDIYQEFAFSLDVGKIPPADRDRGRAQLRRYREDGLPDDHPFTENAIIFRRHAGPERDAALDAAMDLWWEQLETYTKRDQLSLPYVLHKTGLKTKVWDWNYGEKNPYFSRYIHRRDVVRDLSVILKNKRYYNRFYYYFFGVILFLYYNVAKRLLTRRPG